MKSRNSYVLAVLFILVGILFLGKNLGIIDSCLFGILMSWQMLLIVIGVLKLLKGHIIGGVMISGIGMYFMAPMLGWVDNDILRTYWPVIFILLGIGVIFNKDKHWHFHCDKDQFAQKNFTTSNGFVNSNIMFGSTQQIVFDPVFKGAQIKNIMGGNILDLRRTSLTEKETYIDVEIIMGGLELFIPDSWNVQIQIQTTLGGCEDKRFNNNPVDMEHVLIIRGQIILSGVTIKN